MASPMPPMSPPPQAAGPAPPDLSGLGGSAAPTGGDPSEQFMQMVKALDEQVQALATAHPQFAKAADAIKKAIQQGTVEVIGSMKQRPSQSPAAGMNMMG